MATTDNQIVKEIDCVEEIMKMDPSFIPKRYILIEKDVSKDMELPLLSAQVLVIDMALLSEGQEEELKKLDEACMYWGFFLVINHGIDEGVLEDIKTAASEFFKLPLKDKMRYPFDPLAIEGYGRPYPVTEDQTVDWSDSLIGVVEAYSVEIGNISRRLLGSLSLIMGMDNSQSSVQNSVISEYTCMILLEAEKGIKGKINSVEKGKGKKGVSLSSEKKEQAFMV
ncbi:protein LATERAL BRANCHING OXIDOREDUCTASE 1-like [Apium graveolens]|uniref:protein LATERAL BRANCHING OXIDOREDUCTASE 1-like n=1 Tax=Apium graveolens TaxID=4045 RepID=UPI003D78FEFF